MSVFKILKKSIMGLYLDRDLETVRDIVGRDVGPFDESLAHAAGSVAANLQSTQKGVEPSEFDVDPNMSHADVVLEAAKIGARLVLASLRESGALPNDDHRGVHTAGSILNSETVRSAKQERN